MNIRTLKLVAKADHITVAAWVCALIAGSP
jgi:hypothetical protein